MMRNKIGNNFCSINRDYFFFLDNRGLLYLEETQNKNFTNCIKE